MVHLLVEADRPPDQSGLELPDQREYFVVVEDRVAAGDDDGPSHAEGVEHLNNLTGDVVQRGHVENNLLSRTGWPAIRSQYL